MSAERKSDMVDFGIQINRHAKSLESLEAAIDALKEQVESTTVMARSRLAAYRDLKRQTKEALAHVAAGFEEAEGLFAEAHGLFKRLKQIKSEHDRLCRIALKEENEPALQNLRRARKRLQDIYSEIEQLKSEADRADG